MAEAGLIDRDNIGDVIALIKRIHTSKDYSCFGFEEYAYKALVALADKGIATRHNISVIDGFLKTRFPSEQAQSTKEDFPYIIKVGKQFNKSESQQIAGIISGQGHTVILSKDNGSYKIFVGPYRNQEEALESLKKIKTYSLKSSAAVIKR